MIFMRRRNAQSQDSRSTLNANRGKYSFALFCSFHYSAHVPRKKFRWRQSKSMSGNQAQCCSQIVQHCWIVILSLIKQEQRSRGRKQWCLTNNVEQFDPGLNWLWWSGIRKLHTLVFPHCSNCEVCYTRIMSGILVFSILSRPVPLFDGSCFWSDIWHDSFLHDMIYFQLVRKL